jgi:hypothetical protein
MRFHGYIYWILPLVGIGYIAMIINLIRQRRLSEGHALPWLLTFLAVTVTPFFIHLLDQFAHWAGINYEPALYLLIAILFLLANVLRNALEISTLTDKNRRLTQEVSMLRHQVESGLRPPAGSAPTS